MYLVNKWAVSDWHYHLLGVLLTPPPPPFSVFEMILYFSLSTRISSSTPPAFPHINPTICWALISVGWVLVGGEGAWGLSPGQGTASCSWVRLFYSHKPLFTQVYLNSSRQVYCWRVLPCNRPASHPGGSRDTPSRFVLQKSGKTRLACIQSSLSEF